MKSSSVEHQPGNPEFSVYDCEIRLRFKLIEEKRVVQDREHLLEMLLDAFSYGADEYLEPAEIHVEALEVPETHASPQMRRQLIRLRNSREVV